MMINALNSGARVFMADFEDALSPTWQNVVEGQRNLADAVRGTIALETGREDLPAERGDRRRSSRARAAGTSASATSSSTASRSRRASSTSGSPSSTTRRELLERGSGPYFYLPKLESHLEARLWNDAFVLAQDELGIDRGTIRATVLIETILAAFEMDEILYELREHASRAERRPLGLHLQRDQEVPARPEFVLPDRAQVTMTVPFMRAYTELLVRDLPPARRARDGRHGRVHPVPQGPRGERGRAREGARGQGARGRRRLRRHLGRASRPRAGGDRGLRRRARRAAEPGRAPARRRPGRRPAELLSIPDTGGEITDEGVAANVRVGIGYLDAWLRGVGAAAIDNLMEDAATAEISRSQLWQWVRHGRVPARARAARRSRGSRRPRRRRTLFAEVALADEFVEFLTLPAYDRL